MPAISWSYFIFCHDFGVSLPGLHSFLLIIDENITYLSWCRSRFGWTLIWSSRRTEPLVWKLFVTDRFYTVQMVIIFLWPPRPQCNIDLCIFCAGLLFFNIQAQRCNLVVDCVSHSVQRLLEQERQKTKQGRNTSEVCVTRQLQRCLNFEEMGFARSARLCLGVGGLGRSGILSEVWVSVCEPVSERLSVAESPGERGSACTHLPSVNKRA